jgi:hypothetical protein
MRDYQVFMPDPSSAEVKDSSRYDGVNLIFTGHWPGRAGQETELALNFPTIEELGTWLDGPVVGAVQEYQRKKENEPAKVIERALSGSYSDSGYTAEAIINALRDAGHVIITMNKD